MGIVTVGLELTLRDGCDLAYSNVCISKLTTIIFLNVNNKCTRGFTCHGVFFIKGISA